MCEKSVRLGVWLDGDQQSSEDPACVPAWMNCCQYLVFSATYIYMVLLKLCKQLDCEDEEVCSECTNKKCWLLPTKTDGTNICKLIEVDDDFLVKVKETQAGLDYPAAGEGYLICTVSTHNCKMTTAEIHSSPVYLFQKCKTDIYIIVGNNIVMTSQSGNSVIIGHTGATTHMDKSDLFEMLGMDCQGGLTSSLLKGS